MLYTRYNSNITLHVDVAAADPKSYGKCHRQIEVASNATLTLDKDLHYLVFVYNNTFDQECWFSANYPTELFLPMKDPAKECATAGHQPVHPWPHKDQFNLEVQPAGTSRRAQANVTQWAAVPGIKKITLVVDGRMVIIIIIIIIIVVVGLEG